MDGEDAVPLSEHEQRLLEQIERALYAEDPKFASAVRATDPRTRARRKFLIAAGVLVLGVALLLFGITSYRVDNIPVISIAGFVVIVAGAVLAWANYKRMTGREPLRVVGGRGPARTDRSGRPTSQSVRVPGKRRSVFDRMEDRWRRRDDQRGR